MKRVSHTCIVVLNCSEHSHDPLNTLLLRENDFQLNLVWSLKFPGYYEHLRTLAIICNLSYELFI